MGTSQEQENLDSAVMGPMRPYSALILSYSDPDGSHMGPHGPHVDPHTNFSNRIGGSAGSNRTYEPLSDRFGLVRQI